VTQDKLVDQRKAAEMLGCSERALEAMRLRETGPAFVRVSPRCIRYKIEDLQQFIESRRIAPAYTEKRR
jgi:hypothetical protein